MDHREARALLTEAMVRRCAERSEPPNLYSDLTEDERASLAGRLEAEPPGGLERLAVEDQGVEGVVPLVASAHDESLSDALSRLRQT